MDRIINVKVRGHYLTKDNNKAGVQGEANATHLHIEFDPSWEGLAKSVIFFNAHGQYPVKVTLTTNDICASETVPGEGLYVTHDVPIPGEAMTEHGWAEFTLEGVKEGVVAKTITDKLYVHEAPDTTYVEEPTEPPSPTELEKMQAQLESILEKILLAIEAGEKLEGVLTLDEFVLIAKSYAIGGSGARPGEDTDNAKYYYELCLQIATGNTIIMRDDTTGEIYRLGVDNGLLYLQLLRTDYGPDALPEELPDFNGVYIGTDTPPDYAQVWIDPSGEPSSTEAWEFDMEDGTTEVKQVVVV